MISAWRFSAGGGNLRRFSGGGDYRWRDNAGWARKRSPVPGIDGARDLLGVALIIGIARGIVVSLDNGMITHTHHLHSAESLVSGLYHHFHKRNLLVEVLLPSRCPPSSGLAVLTMPIMAPLADLPTYSGIWS